LEDFLFRTRRGHCEFFATAMVVMLRSQGIPARFVTGFLGAEENAFEGYYVVRQSNAHAWVEAWFPDRGWQVFDPTPASGRPGAVERDLPLLLSEVWDYMLFRWDRYVLTFGFYDQVQLLMQARSAWLSFWRIFQRKQSVPDLGSPSGESLPGGQAAPGTEGWSWERWRVPVAIGFVVIVLVAIAWVEWRRLHRKRTATESYRRLRERLERSGMTVPESMAPLQLVRSAGGRFPDASRSTSRLVDLYLRESFAGEELDDNELGHAADSLRQVEQVLKKAG
jgi:hypothetical protein